MKQKRDDGKHVKLKDALHALSIISDVNPSWNIVIVKPATIEWED